LCCYPHIKYFALRLLNLAVKAKQKETDVSGYSCRVTNEGIKHLNLHTLNAGGGFCKITDDGIKHMDLSVLKASYNNNIPDRGIHHMKLYSLDASFNPMITDEGIKVL